jgi:hypothetical protein
MQKIKNAKRGIISYNRFQKLTLFIKGYFGSECQINNHNVKKMNVKDNDDDINYISDKIMKISSELAVEFGIFILSECKKGEVGLCNYWIYKEEVYYTTDLFEIFFKTKYLKEYSAINIK